jgi:creatinine amidohydrolase
MRLDSLSSTEFAERMRKRPVIFLPIGATEAHSSHLPLSTD